MNLLAMLAGLLPWAATPVSAFTRIYLACSVLSLEAQLITWLGRGTLDGLFPINAALAIGAAAWQIKAGRPLWGWVRETTRVLPMAAVLPLLAIVAFLNVWRPLQAADAYQLDRVLQIERSGSLVYSTDIDPKANIVAAFYELVLADLQSVPEVGSWLIKLHGVLGLLIFSLAVAASQEWLPIQAPLARALPFVVPVVFHQLVLIKNDLFIGAPALVALAWAAGSGRIVARELWWAGWLVGLAIAAKLTNAALALVVAASVFVRARAVRMVVTLGLAAGVGMIAGGLLLTFWQNAVVYGDPLAVRQVDAMGSLNRSIGAAVVGLFRFLISLVDMSLATREIWPNRGGWGGAFGLPLLWALAVLIASWRVRPESRRALSMGVVCLLALGVTFPDADLSHRLALGPGVALIVAGASASRAVQRPWVTRSLAAVLALSTVQILRSVVLYVVRP